MNANPAGHLRRMAQTVRHAPILRRMDWLWSLARKPYQSILNWSSEGVDVYVGHCCHVRMPSDFSAGSWENYESQEVRRVVQWLGAHPDGLVLDIGCAVGIYSLITLSCSKTSDVIAFDSDLASLKATERMCSYVPQARLVLVYGFVSNRHGSGWDVSQAERATQDLLMTSGLTGKPGTTVYRCLNEKQDVAIPTSALDGLWPKGYSERPILLKCDVEGAEQLVLEGAARLLAGKNTTLSLSLHPPTLPNYGHSVHSVKTLVQCAGYRMELLASDHEEHWWCEKRP